MGSEMCIRDRGGPPCETFSAARWHDNGPPPLRTIAHYWGIPDATPKQSRQLQIANLLLASLVMLFSAHLVTGTSAWMEHPIPAHWEPRAPPSWDWRPLLALAASPAVSPMDIDQCQFQPPDRPLSEFGQAPTRIMALRLPSLRGLFQARPNAAKCNHPRGSHRTLLGKNDAAKFYTADKTTYPSALCHCLAQAMYKDIIAPLLQTRMNCLQRRIQISSLLSFAFLPL